MMAAFNISEIQALGYDQADLAFTDPLDAHWRARPYAGTHIASVQSKVLPKFAATRAYANVTGIQSTLDHYWSTHSEDSGNDSRKRDSGSSKPLSPDSASVFVLALSAFLVRYLT